MKFVVTIDVEEDNWSRYSTTDNPVTNIRRLVPLQKLFDRYGVRPTYLISYPVATDPESVAVLGDLLNQGNCEIGMHCHPWNTPPFTETVCASNSMLVNLPGTLVLKKLTVLHEVIQENFGVSPVSFRAGRWGFGRAVASSLCRLGYRVDTSVSPYVDWRSDHGPDYSGYQLHPYRFNPIDIATPAAHGALLEVPTTVGFLQRNFQQCQRWMSLIENDLCGKLRLKGILGRLGLLNQVWLSPELADAGAMIRLMQRLREQSFPILNMSFHSTSLLAGLTPFVTTAADEAPFLERIETVLGFVFAAQCECLTLAEFEQQSVTGVVREKRDAVLARPASCVGMS